MLDDLTRFNYAVAPIRPSTLSMDFYQRPCAASSSCELEPETFLLPRPQAFPSLQAIYTHHRSVSKLFSRTHDYGAKHYIMIGNHAKTSRPSVPEKNWEDSVNMIYVLATHSIRKPVRSLAYREGCS
jgi:hypothetical protein